MKKPHPRKICMELTDYSLSAAMMLEQVIYWRKRTKFKGKNGNPVIVSTYKEWAEQCCLTFNKVQYAIRVLKKKKLIETYLSTHELRPEIINALHIEVPDSVLKKFED